MSYPFFRSFRFAFILLGLAGGGLVTALAQPAFEGPPPLREPVERADLRRAAYLERVQEVVDWRIETLYDPADVAKMDISTVVMLLRRGEHLDDCSERVIQLMENPGSGPFWIFPTTMLAFAGRDTLSVEAQDAIREAVRTARQVRGDTENHFVLYYTSMYLLSELYAGEPAEAWATGKSSAEMHAESKGWLLDWMRLTTTIGQGEYNPTHYLGEYAIPMLMLSVWSEDPAMRQRGSMMLDWIFAELANVTLEGVLRGPNSRTDDTSVTQRWQALATYFTWQLFGNTPAPKNNAYWGNYFAALADHYTVPEVIYRIAVDRDQDILQRDRARSRRMWRYSDEEIRPIYKTQYLRKHYAVGSTQGGLSDPIQTHTWDVTWTEADPRGKHPTMFSLHPHSSGSVLQSFFCVYPEPLWEGVRHEGKPSYDEPDKLVGCSPYEQVVQDLDAVIALYHIPEGERYPQVNGFFSKDLTAVVEHDSGWIFARGGDTYLAYRPLADYHWIEHRGYPNYREPDRREVTGSRVLVSPHRRNGTIVQAADVAEFADYAAFQAAILALPLEFTLKPHPQVHFTTLCGREIVAEYGETPLLDGRPIDYAGWDLFGGTHLNSELGSRVLSIRHGRLERVLDFNTLSVADRVLP
ncbi:hypothetical protein [Actomonas aquatica]|uniref:Heparin-sulfate lyase N-terminal domain-containing protein n=1 Tax=Actomonas aquatica TaxID=2866162 RepID=A0ABZ1C6W2_9BACT|nr:hypothetical protein [Opitutus sp. WL0086]WRQ86055.1 hypothetical protein K1X11_014670 [Opitutus sp. WL0086]